MRDVWDRVYEVLTDFEYLQTKIGALPEQGEAPADVFGLLGDFVEALGAMPAGHARREDIERLHRAIDGSSHFLKQMSWLLVQQVYNAWEWENAGLGRKVADAERRCQQRRLRLLNRPGKPSPCLRTLTGHTAGVSSVAYSPNGSRVVSASADNTLKVWDAGTGQELLCLTGHTGSVSSVAYSPDGSRIVSASDDKTLKVWDAGTGQELLTLTGHTRFVRSVAYSPDGSRVVSGSHDKTLKVWDETTGLELASFLCNDAVLAIWFHPDPKQPILHVADRTAGTGIPNVYVLQLVLPSPGRLS